MAQEELLNPKLTHLYNAIARVIAQAEKDIVERKIAPRNFQITIEPNGLYQTSFEWQKSLDAGYREATFGQDNDVCAMLQVDLTVRREGEEFQSTRFISLMHGQKPEDPVK